ncbi:MAG: hypothetical protein ACK4Q5_06530 [Saprospiraceae bacterium]
MKAILPILFTFALAACGGSPKNETSSAAPAPAAASPETSLTGLYVSSGDARIFRDCASGKTYRVDDQTRSLDTLYPKLLLQPSYDGEPVFAILRGKISPPAADGGDGTLAVTRVDSVDFLNFMNCCESYEFWCSGTEPFWNLQIFPTEGEGHIVFREAGGEQAFVFAAVKPTVAGDTWTYTTKNDAGQTLRAVVKKGKASDGMSEAQYNYSCEVTLGKEKYRGVAVKYGEKILPPE